MTFFFFDSSALVKRYVPEQGTPWVRSLTDPAAGHTSIIAQITLVEVVSGAMRLAREGTLTPRLAQAIRLLLTHHAHHEYLVIGLTPSVVQRAIELLEQHPLRAYDAIQLATALEVQDRLHTVGSSSLVFVSADQHLVAVAAAVGLRFADPNAHT